MNVKSPLGRGDAPGSGKAPTPPCGAWIRGSARHTHAVVLVVRSLPRFRLHSVTDIIFLIIFLIFFFFFLTQTQGMG